MRRDRVPRVLRRDRLGHGASGDIADHYTHIDDKMIEEMLTRQTRRWQTAVAERARMDGVRGTEPWLPVWLPRIVSAANLQRTRTEA